jgi:electron transfer flavoprotein alpha subunit
MKILVCIKQVPFVDQIRLDPATRRLVREGVPNEINPFDRRALAVAVNLRNQWDGEIVVVTMGPPQAREALVEALAVGCDRAVHLSGHEFAGSDTLATARALALACKKIGFDLILCGKYSTDAETAQVPPMLAEWLDVPQVTGVTHLEFSDGGSRFAATRGVDDGFEVVECRLPAVLSAAERLAKPLRSSPESMESARQKSLEVWGAADLAADASGFGSPGSSTSVSDTYSVEPKRKRVVRTANDGVDAVAQATVQDLLNEGLFGKWQAAEAHIIRPRRAGGSEKQAIWVVAELVEKQLRLVTFELLGRGIELAEAIGGQLAVVLIGHNIASHTGTLGAYGADKIYLADDPRLASYSTEGYTTVLADAIRAHDPYAVILPSTANGRDQAPRVAARLNVGLTGDCIGLEIDQQQRLVQLKPAFGGNIVSPILTKTRPAMATIRPGMLQSAEPDFSRQAAIVRLPTDQLGAIRTRTVSIERSASTGVELDNAKVIVGVGMGVGGPANLPVVQELASALGAAIGASRRVVDAGWLPPQLQIGLTGRSVAPRLYVAVGISGKFNHMVGVQRAGLVLAVNNNPAAEIFQQCDYGIVGDWAVTVPALAHALRMATQAV